jgi:hypothetical protein
MPLISTTPAQKGIFCCRLHYIRVEGHLGRGERISENFFVTNDRTIIENLIPKHVVAAMGELEYRSLKESPVVAYARLNNLSAGSEQSTLFEHLLLLGPVFS